jgi:hypothetical protein
MSNTITTEILDAKLRTIRGLLDKAEATDNEAEQEIFTAKAFDLMARYSIDQAMLDASRPKADRGEVIEREVFLGSGPYVLARYDLIHSVAHTFGCKALTIKRFDGRYALLHGFESDVATIEVLYTSLLVQVTRVMRATPVPARVNGTTFRRNFIIGFADRVGLRLAAQTVTVIAEAQEATEPGSESVALVLADRKAEVDDFTKRRYGRIGRISSGGQYDSAGREAGDSAGRKADITTGGRVSSGARELAS